MVQQSTVYTVRSLANLALGLFVLSALTMGTAGTIANGMGIFSRWQIQISLCFLAWGFGALALCFIKHDDGTIPGYIGKVLLVFAALEAQLGAIFVSNSPSEGLQLDYMNEHIALIVAMGCILSAIFMLTISLNHRGDWRLEYHAGVILTVFMVAACGASALVRVPLQHVCTTIFAVCMFAWCGIVSFHLGSATPY